MNGVNTGNISEKKSFNIVTIILFIIELYSSQIACIC